MFDSREFRPRAGADGDLSGRLLQVRLELYGERGETELARLLGIPTRTWSNYEAGVSIPANILLEFLILTDVEPLWLLREQGERFRSCPEIAPGKPINGFGE